MNTEGISLVDQNEFDVVLLRKSEAESPMTEKSGAKVETRVGMKRMTMIVTAAFHTRLKMHAVSNGIHLEDVYREALDDYATKHGIA